MPSFKEILGVQDVTDKKGRIWKCLLVELIGNLLLNFFGCACYIIDPSTVKVGLTFGFVVFILVQAFGHVSGGHFNPAVTIAFLILGKISIIKGLLYIVVQCAGAISGSYLLKGLTPDYSTRGLGATGMARDVKDAQGLGIEFLLGMTLVFVVFASVDEERGAFFNHGPPAIGLTVGMGNLAAEPITGASMNPARSLGAAMAAEKWTGHWVYWVGPILGGIVASLVYHFLLRSATLEKKDDE